MIYFLFFIVLAYAFVITIKYEQARWDLETQTLEAPVPPKNLDMHVIPDGKHVVTDWSEFKQADPKPKAEKRPIRADTRKLIPDSTKLVGMPKMKNPPPMPPEKIKQEVSLTVDVKKPLSKTLPPKKRKPVTNPKHKA